MTDQILTKSPDALAAFLRGLSELSYRHGLAIDEHGIVFVMESDDYERTYALVSDYLHFE